jgi:hypothetical protein
MLELNSKWSEFVDLLPVRNACDAGINWTKDVLDKDPSMSMATGMEFFLDDPQAPQKWAVWILLNLYDDMSQDLRYLWIKKITYEMEAFQLYIHQKNFTEEEEKILEALFKNKLPTAEKELATGIVVKENICR